ncbi:MAG TPA: M20 family metallo-hydrolase [Acidobacteriota bacterium]|nr:M20 family metallo-hydrolase [Acidobacteriota bacterium]
MLNVSLHVDQPTLQRQIDELATYSESSPPGVTRVLFSEADVNARQYLKDLCRDAALSIREDGAGNLFARWSGTDAVLAPVATGSHIDAIPNAGRYDGTVGALGGLEAIRALRRAGFQPVRAIELIIFTSEEPTRFGIGCLGSRMLAGTISAEAVERLRDREGRSFDQLRALAGCDEQSLQNVKLSHGAYDAFLELHIEQGAVLERENIPIGVVTAIAAPSTLRMELTGVGGHAGAVLMPHRHDALLAGAEIALRVEQSALKDGGPDTVATTGIFRIEPDAVNSIPSKARLEIDLRDTDVARRDHVLKTIEASALEICRRRGIDLSLEVLNADPPATCDSGLVGTVAEVCEALGFRHRKMISRAYHDSLFMAQICPASMIFIPCRNGVSHRPDEYASPEHIAQGVEVLAHSLARLSATPEEF